tara:strand:- start:104 stop:499 length:396 start_codon:yes stop_codon:yes gene_type:complete
MSDLTLTRAGTVEKIGRSGNMNPASEFGQAGSVYTVASSDAIVAPNGAVFVAITMVTDCTFDASGGLIAEDPNKYINTETAAHDLAASSETDIVGSGGQVVDSVSFPAGMTIHGRWTEIDIDTGSCIAYIG